MIGHVPSPNLLNDLLSPISRHWPSFKCFWYVEVVGLKRHFVRARPLLDEEGVASQLWTLCCRSCLAIFEIFSNNNVSNRKRCTLRKGSFKTSSNSWNIKFLVNSQYYTYLPFTCKQLTNMDYFRALFGSQSIYKQNFEIYGTQNFNRRIFYVK